MVVEIFRFYWFLTLIKVEFLHFLRPNFSRLTKVWRNLFFCPHFKFIKAVYYKMLVSGNTLFAFIFGAKAELRIELLNGCIKQYETNHIYLGPSNVISFHQWEYLLRSICQPPKIVGTSSSWSKVQNSAMWITILKSK